MTTGHFLPPEFLDELRQRITLSSLIGRTVKLTRAGREFRACCPFHNEKTPSFYVNDEKGFYHCFGCGAHGDAIRFVTETRGLSFMDAVRELAGQAGMDIPEANPAAVRQAKRTATLHDIMAEAAKWFSEQLHGIEGAEVRRYLDNRGISPAIAQNFGLGFAPNGRGRLKNALSHHAVEKLIEVGLLISVEGRDPYDRFRGRLMIPIKDQRGRVIAFGGRRLESIEGGNSLPDNSPKYLNSPETPLFDKGRTLYNIDKASQAARRQNRIIVVEGYLDVIGLAQAGIHEAVAPLGTALTEHQIERLWRIEDKPILCFDGDSAGQKAAVRAAERALVQARPGKTLSFVTLPNGKDPDDLVKEQGKSAFEEVLSRPIALDRLLYRFEASQIDPRSPEGRAALSKRLDELAASCRDEFIARGYRSNFKNLFYENFGWKSKKQQDSQTTIAATVTLSDLPTPTISDLECQYSRQILIGLSLYPEAIKQRLERLAELAVTDPKLKKWRETLITAVISEPDLDRDTIKAILKADANVDIDTWDIKKDLRFPFTRPDIAPDLAIESLVALIDLVVEERELATEEQQLKQVFTEERLIADYAKFEAAQALHRKRRADFQERRYMLGMEFELRTRVDEG
ncbi:DNA primase [Zymomonas mobilis]|uniref:DNA primase n=1 Tax=Zymomonas mobilis subsp. mobilis (strain ATCC 10988 / DSM 424 / LMG 404 / NCIMB 8938 / NRRL B-806 / ZM1) TaxID=555217 RepID=A0A0H3G3Z0_ZYMMA|nr:DNA primase [Zymomonas mobilis]AEH63334.1 DNA primase [Zymomonas mobilis subsp. mobilis ATCC 10988]TQL27051.1 DNA primase [Zymomonas mobilis]TQL28479.1 DNA primase [Zymomonas mobilis]